MLNKLRNFILQYWTYFLVGLICWGMGNFFRPQPPGTWAAVSVKGVELVYEETIKVKDTHPDLQPYFTNILRYNYLQAIEYREIFKIFYMDTTELDRVIEKFSH